MIVHVTRDYPPRSVGGISSALPPIVEAAVAAGQASAVVSFDAWRPTRGAALHTPTWTVENDVPVLRVDTHTSLDSASRQAVALAPSHVQVHHEMLWEFGSQVARSCSATTSLAVHVWQPHNNAARGFDTPTLSLAAQLKGVREADALCAPTPITAEAVSAVAGRSVAVAPLALEALWFNAPEVEPSPGRIVFAGRFEATKGLDTLLDAVRALDVAAELHVAGGLPHNTKLDRRMSARLEQTPGVVSYGWLGARALRDLIDSAHVVACPSRVESFGLVAAQALARGGALVANPVGVAALWANVPGVYLCHDGRRLPDVLREALQGPRPGISARAALCDSLRAEAVLAAWQAVWGVAGR